MLGCQDSCVPSTSHSNNFLTNGTISLLRIDQDEQVNTTQLELFAKSRERRGDCRVMVGLERAIRPLHVCCTYYKYSTYYSGARIRYGFPLFPYSPPLVLTVSCVCFVLCCHTFMYLSIDLFLCKIIRSRHPFRPFEVAHFFPRHHQYIISIVQVHQSCIFLPTKIPHAMDN